MPAATSEIRAYLAKIGASGGRKSRRSLSKQQAKEMVLVREARRAYRRFYTQCFWSFDPNLQIRFSDVTWVAQQLRKHGGREAWFVAERLCH